MNRQLQNAFAWLESEEFVNDGSPFAFTKRVESSKRSYCIKVSLKEGGNWIFPKYSWDFNVLGTDWWKNELLISDNFEKFEDCQKAVFEAEEKIQKGVVNPIDFLYLLGAKRDNPHAHNGDENIYRIPIKDWIDLVVEFEDVDKCTGYTYNEFVYTRHEKENLYKTNWSQGRFYDFEGLVRNLKQHLQLENRGGKESYDLVLDKTALDVLDKLGFTRDIEGKFRYHMTADVDYVMYTRKNPAGNSEIFAGVEFNNGGFNVALVDSYLDFEGAFNHFRCLME